MGLPLHVVEKGRLSHLPPAVDQAGALSAAQHVRGLLPAVEDLPWNIAHHLWSIGDGGAVGNRAAQESPEPSVPFPCQKKKEGFIEDG